MHFLYGDILGQRRYIDSGVFSFSGLLGPLGFLCNYCSAAVLLS